MRRPLTLPSPPERGRGKKGWVAVVAILFAACAASDVPKPPKLDQWALYDSDDHTIVKKSRDGVCHDYTSGHFEHTVHYTAYRTMEDCKTSGGREAKQ
jgi:hypothetical protein